MDINANPYYCTTELALWTESGNSEERPDPRFHKTHYKRIECGRCGKCDKDIDWKQKAFDLAKCYGETLKHLDELQVDNAYLKAENRMLFDVIKAGVNETITYISERSRNFHPDITAVYTSSDLEHEKE